MNISLREKYILHQLDLEPIVIKAMDSKEGHGWSFSRAVKASEEYRKYLALCLKYPDAAIVPSTVVDDFWHLHILDTAKYMQDCEHCFGYFLHHFPYFGMRGDQDASNLQTAWEQTLVLYEKNFGAPPKNLWPKSTRCPNCGRRIEGDGGISMQKRPSYADYRLGA